MNKFIVRVFLLIGIFLSAYHQLQADGDQYYACSTSFQTDKLSSVPESLVSHSSLSPLTDAHINLFSAVIETTENEISGHQKLLKTGHFFTLVLCAFVLTSLCSYINNGLAYYKNFSNFISYSRFIVLRVIRL